MVPKDNTHASYTLSHYQEEWSHQSIYNNSDRIKEKIEELKPWRLNETEMEF